MAELIEAAWGTIERVRERRPLVHQMTNLVVMNDTANATLAFGASPVMAIDAAEVGEMAAQADALVLNLGTPLEERFAAMAVAGAAANAAGRPIVVDPVGYGATGWRTARTDDLLRTVRPAIIRGNAGEIMRLCGSAGGVRGVESAASVARNEVVVRAAGERACVLVVSGRVDLVTDGRRTAHIANGSPMLTTITGAGCIATAVIACCAAVADDALVAAVAGMLAIGISAERAAQGAAGPGSFRTALIDALANLDRTSFVGLAQVATAGCDDVEQTTDHET